MTDQAIMEQFQLLSGMMEKMTGAISALPTREEMNTAIRESEARTKLFIENTVTSQIKGLFEGYQSALENQALLRIANETLAKELDALKMRVAALESKTA